MVITVQYHEGEWMVWAALVAGDPASQGESFIIGQGDTKQDAIAEALTELHVAAAECQAALTDRKGES